MSRVDIDPVLESWFDETAPRQAPDGLLPAVERELARHGPKRRWLAFLTEHSMRRSSRVVVGSSAVRAAYLIVVLVLLVAVAAGAIAVGSQLLPSPPSRELEATGLIAYDTNAQIFVVDDLGRNVRVLVGDLTGTSSPTWSPDGRKLAFWADADDKQAGDLYVVDADGSQRVRIAREIWIAGHEHPSWSRDGRQIVFSGESGPDRNDERLFIVNVDGSGMAQLGLDRPADPLRRLLPAWSPDGRWISFQAIPASLPADESQLYVIRPDGRDEHRLLTPGRYFWPPGPAWEPRTNNPRLTFAGGDLRFADIYVYDVNVDRATVLSGDRADEAGPSWSPDGRRVAWFSSDAAGNDSIKIAYVDGSNSVQAIPADGISRAVAWSPDGTKLYGTNANKTAVIVLSIDSSGPPIVISHPGGQGTPSWQPLTP
jgi:TolB protein